MPVLHQVAELSEERQAGMPVLHQLAEKLAAVRVCDY